MKRRVPPDPVELVAAPAAIERALGGLCAATTARPFCVIASKKNSYQRVYGMVDRGEQDERRLTVGGLAHLKAVERDHAIKSALMAPKKMEKTRSNRRLNRGRHRHRIAMRTHRTVYQACIQGDRSC
jgi:hypothetical protein